MIATQVQTKSSIFTQASSKDEFFTGGLSKAEQKVLLITKRLLPCPKGGREMLCKINHEALSVIFGAHLIVFDLPHFSPKTLKEKFFTLGGYIDGLTPQGVTRALELIRREDVRQVFVDGSNFGGFVSKLKRSLPSVEVITFFHNVEARFFGGALGNSKSFRALTVLIVNYLAERKATHLSDKRICLSQRDSTLLQSLYGKGATHISPIALADKLSDQPVARQVIDLEPFALFVGSNFYANRDGIAWFVRNVSQRIDIRICVVGEGMEDLRHELESPGRVSVIGSVDNLSSWYKRALFVIAPIFDGSGMKTKVAEALMYGKKVVGTREAFSGYEDIASIAGWSCENADEFVDAIKLAQRTIKSSFDPNLRELYEKKFSFSAATSRLAAVFFA